MKGRTREGSSWREEVEKNAVEEKRKLKRIGGWRGGGEEEVKEEEKSKERGGWREVEEE